jgi:SAM-dependent methyltransferase
MSGFKDHFSGHARDYAAARPTYPPELFAWLGSLCAGREAAWDAGCGNGQASLGLAAVFDRVEASDPSATQIEAASPHPRVHYRVEAAEDCSLPDASCDAVVAAQSYHWMRHAAFCAQARRVLRPGGVLLLACYGNPTLDPGFDRVYHALYEGRLGPDWPPERVHVESGYRDLPFPFAEVPGPAFVMQAHWTLAQMLAYLRSWSAAQRYLGRTGRDAVAEFAPALTDAWGQPQAIRTVRWPLALRVGRGD